MPTLRTLSYGLNLPHSTECPLSALTLHDVHPLHGLNLPHSTECPLSALTLHNAHPSLIYDFARKQYYDGWPGTSLIYTPVTKDSHSSGNRLQESYIIFSYLYVLTDPNYPFMTPLWLFKISTFPTTLSRFFFTYCFVESVCSFYYNNIDNPYAISEYDH